MGLKVRRDKLIFWSVVWYCFFQMHMSTTLATLPCTGQKKIVLRELCILLIHHKKLRLPGLWLDGTFLRQEGEDHRSVIWILFMQFVRWLVKFFFDFNPLPWSQCIKFGARFWLLQQLSTLMIPPNAKKISWFNIQYIGKLILPSDRSASNMATNRTDALHLSWTDNFCSTMGWAQLCSNKPCISDTHWARGCYRAIFSQIQSCSLVTNNLYRSKCTCVSAQSQKSSSWSGI